MRTHEEIREEMLHFLEGHLIGYRTVESGCVRASSEGQDFLVIPSTASRQVPNLEQRMRENTGKGIATAVLFAKSFYCQNVHDSYEGAHGYRFEVKEENGTWRHKNQLSTTERFIKDNFKGSLYYFNANTGCIEALNFRRMSEQAIMALIERSRHLDLAAAYSEDDIAYEGGMRHGKADTRTANGILKEGIQMFRQMNTDKEFELMRKLHPGNCYSLSSESRSGILYARFVPTSRQRALF